MKENKKRISHAFLWWLVSFIVMLIVMWCSPLVSDDIEFKALSFDNFSDIFNHSLYYGNGRLLGNIIVIYLVNSRLLGCLVRALSISLIVILIPSVLHITSRYSYALSFLLVLGVSPAVFGQVFSWISGFSNYVFPVLGVLLIIRLIQALEKNECKTLPRIVGNIAIFIIGLASQLFVENATTTFILLSLSLVLNSFYSKQKHCLSRITWFISALLGGALMFIIPRKFYLEGNRAEGYRGFFGEGIKELLAHLISSTSAISISFANSLFLLLAIYLCIRMLVKTIEGKSRLTNYLRLSSFTALIYSAANYLLRQNNWYCDSDSLINLTKIISSIGAIVLLINFVIAVFTISDAQLKHTLLLIIIFAVIPAAQLLIVYPVSERAVWISVIAITAAVLKFGDYYMSKENSDCKSANKESGLLVINCMFTIALLAIFVNIKQLDNVRQTYISDKIEQGCEEIDIFAIPYEYAFWDTAWAYHDWETSPDGKKITYNVMETSEWFANYYEETHSK